MPKVILPTTPPFNLLFFRQVSARFRRVPPGFRQVFARFRQVPPGFAGFRRVPPGSVWLRRVLVGSGRVSASLGLQQGREAVRFASSYKFFFPSFCQAPAVSNARPVTTSHNLSVLLPKQFSAELSAQHYWGAVAAWAALLWNQGPRNQLVQSNARRWTLETFNRQLGRR